MPNWVKNKIIAHSQEDFKKLLEFVRLVKNEDGTRDLFDFNKIVAEPQTMEQCPADYFIPNEKDRGYEQLENREWFDWYNWHLNFWGTKWNSCDTQIDDSIMTIMFDTAWSEPQEIAKKLGKLGINFTWFWSEEQLSEYGGHFESDANSFEIVEYEPCSKEMENLAIDLWGYSWKEFNIDEEDE